MGGTLQGLQVRVGCEPEQRHEFNSGAQKERGGSGEGTVAAERELATPAGGMRQVAL